MPTPSYPAAGTPYPAQGYPVASSSAGYPGYYPPQSSVASSAYPGYPPSTAYPGRWYVSQHEGSTLGIATCQGQIKHGYRQPDVYNN
jgi:hypothetical protein